jgi:hypothetical protein
MPEEYFQGSNPFKIEVKPEILALGDLFECFCGFEDKIALIHIES